ncbi:GGDEF domain-containing protein [Streptomyces hoynatensis]|uniref:GGDEF domain-containing protein n=1 Tax=Streptomyces hoynatensis TaxID=1141874 RepID=A0A3A9ZHU1_9ACTN|nr:GGDEF domain-containing protein [Streptomyces hoynatensis]RKN46927.1 GGDEF domain-containing protein [Streptomyces hoynatensis]
MGEVTQLRAVVALAQRMAAEPGLPEVARAAADGARRALGGSFAAISVWERERGRLRVLANVGELAEGEEEFPADESYPVGDFPEIAELRPVPWVRGEEPRAWVVSAEEAGREPEAAGGGGPGAGARTGAAEGAGTRPARGTQGAGGSGGRQADAGSRGTSRAAALLRRGRGSCVVAPVVLHGRAWGELYVARGRRAARFGPDEADFASVLASVAAAGLVQHERLAEARRLALTDPLTGLANRRAVDAALDEALERHLATGAAVSLVVCDINGLKRVNDTHGHAVGDRLLERFGSVLSRCAAAVPGALAARLGGDEFCLLAVGAPPKEVERAAEELCRRAGELPLGEGVACGMAATGEAVGPLRSARRLFRLADAAQYQAKAARSRLPVVAGRGGAGDVVLALAEAPAAEGGQDRRAFRGRAGTRGRGGPSRDNGRPTAG